jgi:hypothetical protein
MEAQAVPALPSVRRRLEARQNDEIRRRGDG